MNGLHHTNVCTMIGACWQTNLMALVMEFCEKGTISTVIRHQGDVMSWSDPYLKWTMDVARGMKYLHAVVYYNTKEGKQEHGIIHRDLKPDNCLIAENYSVKIADFGEARGMEHGTMTMVGTPLYIAPEIMKGEHYDQKVDVFSFALTLVKIGVGKEELHRFLGKVRECECEERSNELRVPRRGVARSKAANRHPTMPWTHPPLRLALLIVVVFSSLTPLVAVYLQEEDQGRQSEGSRHPDFRLHASELLHNESLALPHSSGLPAHA